MTISKRDRVMRLFWWAHRKQEAAFHAVDDPNRVARLAAT